MRKEMATVVLLCIIGMGLATTVLGEPLLDNKMYSPAYPGPNEGLASGIYPLPFTLPTPTTWPGLVTLYIPYWAVPAITTPSSSGSQSQVDTTRSAGQMGYVTRQGDQFWCDGQPFTFAGICIHYLSAPSFPEEEVEGVVAYLASEGVTAIRLWLLSSYDMDRFERLLDLGRRYDMRFVVTLVDYYFDKDVSWFKGEGRNEYLEHARCVVTRFRDRPEIIIWELMNEPGCGPEGGSQSCSDTLYEWVAAASAEIKALDPDRPISIGTMRAGWTEAEKHNYYRMHALSTIDVVSVHKRASRRPQPELDTAQQLGKPVLIGEVWSQAYKENCRPLTSTAIQERARKIEADLIRSLEDGVDGYLLWNYSHGAVVKGNGKEYFCSIYGYFPGDPTFAALRQWQEKNVPSTHRENPY